MGDETRVSSGRPVPALADPDSSAPASPSPQPPAVDQQRGPGRPVQRDGPGDLFAKLRRLVPPGNMQGSLPFFLGAAIFSVLAILDHASGARPETAYRLFPLWVLFVIYAVIAATGGVTTLFVGDFEATPPSAEGRASVTLSRASYDRLLQQASLGVRTSRERPPQGDRILTATGPAAPKARPPVGSAPSPSPAGTEPVPSAWMETPEGTPPGQPEWLEPVEELSTFVSELRRSVEDMKRASPARKTDLASTSSGTDKT